MKIIELLNKIANNEEVPNMIHHQYYVYEWNYIDNDYQRIDGQMLLGNMNIQYHLNDEIEIIEEKPKKIDKLCQTLNRLDIGNDFYRYIMENRFTLNDLVEAVNYLLEKESDK